MPISTLGAFAPEVRACEKGGNVICSSSGRSSRISMKTLLAVAGDERLSAEDIGS